MFAQTQEIRKKEKNGENELLASLRSMNEKDVARFPFKPSADYSGKKTILLSTDEAAVLTPKNKTEGICTDYAIDCSIVIGVARNPINGKVESVGMLHVGEFAANQKNLDAFFRKLAGGKPVSVEITIISGSEKVAKEAFRNGQKHGKIVFLGYDQHTARNDAAAVDRNGSIYYGEIPYNLYKLAEKPEYRHYDSENGGTYWRTTPPGTILYREAK